MTTRPNAQLRPQPSDAPDVAPKRLEREGVCAGASEGPATANVWQRRNGKTIPTSALDPVSQERRRLFWVWWGMLKRCHRPKDKDFHKYGARGVVVCERWRESFANFLADMGERPTPKHSIDRVDGTGNYEPTNCRWVVHLVQARNKRSVKLTVEDVARIRRLIIDGDRRVDIAKRFGVSETTIGGIKSGKTWPGVTAEAR